jgi:threonine dehydratase
MQELVSLQEIKAAAKNLPRTIRRTPMVALARRTDEVGHERLLVKAENLQVTGAYKVRAAFTLVNDLSPSERKKGIVLASSGNFAQGFSYACSQVGMKVVAVMLDRTSEFKLRETSGYGAEIFLCGNNALGRQSVVDRLARERGMVAIDTWEDRRLIIGHGTVGLEIIEDCPDLETVLVPVSSGGMAAGIAVAVKELRPNARVIGVQPETANAAFVSLRQGKPTAIDYWNTIADGLSAVRPGELPFLHIQKYLDDIVLVSEEEIAQAFRTLLLRCKIVAEPAGAVAPAALLSGKVSADRTTVAVVGGGNVTPMMVEQMLRMSKSVKVCDDKLQV